jgi:hypothetical protein
MNIPESKKKKLTFCGKENGFGTTKDASSITTNLSRP